MGVAVAVLAGVGVVAAVLVLVIVVRVFEGSTRPSVKDDVHKLVVGKSQLPSGFELQNEGCTISGGPKLRGCYTALYRRTMGSRFRDVYSGAYVFADAPSASTFVRTVKTTFEQVAFCTTDGRDIPRSQIQLTDLPSPGLGDESSATELRCPTGVTGDLYIWRVENVAQLVAAAKDDKPHDLARKIEARK